MSSVLPVGDDFPEPAFQPAALRPRRWSMHALGSKPIALIDAMSGIDAYQSRKYRCPNIYCPKIITIDN
ncbi:MAG: hypothetical protein RXR06_10000 [Thermoproteus sp.]